MPRRMAGIAALALVAVAACGPSAVDPSAVPERVVLLTRDPSVIGCPANVVHGPLVVDIKAGTAIIDNGVRKPIRWPPGYSGRRSGGEIEILDASGTVVGRTGTVVALDGGEVERGTWLTCPGPVRPE